ncbi:MAG: hypothetical protein ACJ71T_04910 [Actinomycetales bacterium]
MSSTKVIRYRTKPERADENAALIKAVFAELADKRPEGVRYAALRLDDGESFVHVVQLDGDVNPLSDVAAFQAFQAEIGDRVAEGPFAADATVVGAYGVFG